MKHFIMIALSSLMLAFSGYALAGAKPVEVPEPPAPQIQVQDKQPVVEPVADVCGKGSDAAQCQTVEEADTAGPVQQQQQAPVVIEKDQKA
ncbi:MAG: hypothetical protein KDI15_07955 [Thiothrix sp.]|nr:hypothetical protein [Thiothrix sp.]HPE61066.1 hypothetical protein [Thiolinea sp.]